MPIKYKAIERTEPGVAGGGAKKWYATVVTKGATDIDRLTQNIEKISTVSGADIRAVLYSLVDVATGELAEGRIVRLGDLGSLRISISSTGVAAAGEVVAASIRGARILFTPGPRLRTLLQTLRYERV